MPIIAQSLLLSCSLPSPYFSLSLLWFHRQLTSFLCRKFIAYFQPISAETCQHTSSHLLLSVIAYLSSLLLQIWPPVPGYNQIGYTVSLFSDFVNSPSFTSHSLLVLLFPCIYNGGREVRWQLRPQTWAALKKFSKNIFWNWRWNSMWSASWLIWTWETCLLSNIWSDFMSWEQKLRTCMPLPCSGCLYMAWVTRISS